MPVLGHAFVGLATATCTRPKKVDTAGAALWAPILVGLAYLPDIVNQIAITAGLGNRQIVTHSFFFAVAASLLIGPALAWLARRAVPGIWLLTLFSISMHVVLDILQGSNRQPWWPFSDQHVKLKERVIPIGMYREVLLFGIPFAIFWVGHSLVAWWLASRRRRRGAPIPVRRPTARVSHRSSEDPPAYEAFPLPAVPPPLQEKAERYVEHPDKGSARYRRLVWAGRIVTATILLSAATLHYLKGVRNRDLEQAFTLVRQRDYANALTAIERAERWPYVASPGHIEYAKALCYEGLGDRDRAEAWFLASIRADPSYFWPLADLVEFYATAKEPLAERRRRAMPYLERLRTRFAWHYRQAQFVKSMERALADPPRRAPSAPRTPPTKPAPRAPLRR